MTESSAVAIKHILESLELHKTRYNTLSAPLPPLFVAIQGPQGSGKTHLTRILQDKLTSPPHNFQLAVISIDDLYLNHDGLVALATQNPANNLWAGRGQPGTHDIQMGAHLLRSLFSINQGDTDREVELPVFEKSLYNGEGDRLPPGDPRNPKVKVPPRLDIVVLEGWCTGFSSIKEDMLTNSLDNYLSSRSAGVGDDPFDYTILKKDDLLSVNRSLRKYEDMWKWFTCFIQIKPSHIYAHIYRWRLEAERNMKGKNGGKGMTDEQVKRFVDRYVPGYLFFLDTIQNRDPGLPAVNWKNNGLRLLIDENREYLGSEKF